MIFSQYRMLSYVEKQAHQFELKLFCIYFIAPKYRKFAPGTIALPTLCGRINSTMGNKKFYLIRLVLLLSDFIIINLPFLIVNIVSPIYPSHPNQIFTLTVLLSFNISWLLFSQIFNLYTQHILSVTEYMLRRTLRTMVCHSLLFSLLYYLTEPENFNIYFLAGTFGMMCFLLLVSRFLLTYVTEFVFKTVVSQKKIAIVGYNEKALQLAKYFSENESFYKLAGFFDNRSQYTVDDQGNLIGSIEDCLDFAVENDVSEIYSTILPNEDKRVSELTETAESRCVRVRFVTTKTVDEATFFHVDVFSTMPVISLRAEPLQKTRNSLRKRVFDLVVSTMAILFVLSWLTPLLAILIKLSSKGPVFFRQQRSGKDNKTFWCYKFRSMTVSNPNEAQQATKNDSRITRIGAIMRKTSIDELPQFFNVFCGEMSITGPRPHMLLHTEEYSAIIKKYMVRQFLKPGITGWAQVNGYRGETADPALMEKRVEYDIWYMENWSLMLDIKILFMTVINIFKGESNAY